MKSLICVLFGYFIDRAAAPPTSTRVSTILLHFKQATATHLSLSYLVTNVLLSHIAAARWYCCISRGLAGDRHTCFQLYEYELLAHFTFCMLHIHERYDIFFIKPHQGSLLYLIYIIVYHFNCNHQFKSLLQ